MKLYNENCIKQMQTMIDAGEQVDSIVTDPPYELGFMGKSWDSTGIAFQKETWELALQLLKPGGHLLAFGGSRTYHRMAVAIEDAGFEIRDQIMWLYGSGFPKSLNIGKAVDNVLGKNRTIIGKQSTEIGKHLKSKEGPGAGGNKPAVKNRYTGNVLGGPASSEAERWEGWGTALKPAHEPIVLARKPVSEKTVAENVLKHGTGGINIDECRVETNEELGREQKDGPLPSKYGFNDNSMGNKFQEGSPLGRFPANVLHDGSDEVMEGFPTTSKSAGGGGMRGKGGQIYGEYKGKEYDKIIGFGDVGSAGRYFKEITQGRFPANVIHDGSEEVLQGFPDTKTTYVSEKHKNVRTTESAVGDLGHPGNQGFNDEGSAGRYFKTIQKGKPYSYAGREYENSKESSMFKQGDKPQAPSNYNDDGSPARFFYCAKVSRKERNRGLEGLKSTDRTPRGNNQGTRVCVDCGLTDNGTNNHNECSGKFEYKLCIPTKNNHPTVKPVELMKYLCKLITPKGGTILDPFMGSGSTGMAAKDEGFAFIGIEKEQDYYNIALQRIRQQSPLKEFV